MRYELLEDLDGSYYIIDNWTGQIAAHSLTKPEARAWLEAHRTVISTVRDL